MKFKKGDVISYRNERENVRYIVIIKGITKNYYKVTDFDGQNSRINKHSAENYFTCTMNIFKELDNIKIMLDKMDKAN